MRILILQKESPEKRIAKVTVFIKIKFFQNR